jgi:hypothetical protein
MLKKMLLATTVVGSLAGAAHAQQSVDSLCAQPSHIPSQQVVCSSLRLKANAQRNLNALVPLARNLSRPEVIALFQTITRKSNEHMTYCRLAIDRLPQLPLGKATEDCLAAWQDISYAEYQRGILPEHNPQTATNAGLTADQQQLIYRAQQNAYNGYQADEQAAAKCRLFANNSGGGSWAIGSPAFVLGATILSSIGEAAHAQANYRDCMLAQGQQP